MYQRLKQENLHYTWDNEISGRLLTCLTCFAEEETYLSSSKVIRCTLMNLISMP